jgi:hypothetical protein
LKNSEWAELVDKYLRLKNLYIESEETDPELNTNLQPYNEFRAALDHIIRLINIELELEKEPTSQELKGRFTSEYDKLNSHIRRAYFDVCDWLSINYRNKIVDLLSVYTPHAISMALPQYYSTIRPEIETISCRIREYRYQKGINYSDEELMEAYDKDVKTLREHYKTILSCVPSFVEIKQDEVKSRRRTLLIKIVMVVIGAIIGYILSLVKDISVF